MHPKLTISRIKLKTRYIELGIVEKYERNLTKNAKLVKD
jgi:hypothetical protein